MDNIALVANWDAKPRMWHFVREQYRLDLALSLCGIDNGESWLVHIQSDQGGTICNECVKVVLKVRGVIV